MDFDVSSVEGETQLQEHMQVQQLMWWKQNQEEFPDLIRMTTTDSTWQYLPLLCLLRGSSVVWDLYRLTCAGVFWTPP